MKNKFLIGVLTVFAGIFVSILILNLSNSSSNRKTYNFDRNFSKNEILKLVSEHYLLNVESVNELFVSNKNIIIESRIKNINNGFQEINLDFSDCDFVKKDNKKIKLPIDAIIFYVDDAHVIYLFEKKLYSLDVKTIIKIVVDASNIKISNIISLDNQPNNFLVFGEVFENNIFKVGFYTLDFLTGKKSNYNIIDSNKESFKPEITTMNSGRFQRIDKDLLSYTCDKNSKIFLFNGVGKFISLLNTKDNTPSPKVIKNERGDCFYSRNGLSYSNSGVFANSENIFVFSIASEFKDRIIIDQYSIKTLKYIKSFKLNYKNFSSNDIVNVYINDGNIILKFQSNYASFKFSRY